MKENCFKSNKCFRSILILILLLFSIFWELLFGLKNSLSAFYFFFFVLSVFGGALLYKNFVESKFILVTLPFSLFFSFSIYLANRDFLPFSMSLENICRWVITFAGSMIVFYLASFTVLHVNLINCKRENIPKASVVSFFIIPFLGMCLVDIFVLVFCCFPGNVDPDSVNVLKQVYEEAPLSNHHPFVYTLLLKKVVFLTDLFFHDLNYGVMVFLIIQIICISLVFAFSIISLFRMGINKVLLKILVFMSICWPQNINYSITVGKDPLFASFVLLFVTTFLRINKRIGKMFLNYFFFVISIMGLCYLRSNGAFICLGMIFVAILLFLKENRKFCAIFVISFFISVISKNTVIKINDIQKPDTIEALAVPTQQIARVIARGNGLKSEEKDLLSAIVDIDKVPDAYNSFWVDFVKDLVRKKGNQDYLREQKVEYIKMYLSLGLRNPSEYIKAWIDETSGYYVPQESFGLWYEGVENNNWGYARKLSKSNFRNIYLKYVSLINNNLGLRVYLCIAFLVWLSNMLLIKAMVRSNKAAILCGSYCVFLILSLLISAPLNASYRYVYSLACVLPFVLFVSLDTFCLEKSDNNV